MAVFMSMVGFRCSVVYGYVVTGEGACVITGGGACVIPRGEVCVTLAGKFASSSRGSLRHPRAGGDPVWVPGIRNEVYWIPACAGMTDSVRE
ncbi:MAG: hypothetical protein ABJL54_16275 [Halioglobus sp.]